MKVYRFISEATVEENIYLRQVYKQVTEAREGGRGEEEGESGEGSLRRRGERERGERERGGEGKGTMRRIYKCLVADIHSGAPTSNWPTWQWRAVESGDISQPWRETGDNRGSSLAMSISLRCSDQAPISHWIS